MLSFQGGIRVPSYTATKSGVAGITRLLANEWAAKDINVNAIAPGYMATDNTAALRADESAARKSSRASRPAAGARRRISAARRCSWPRRPPIMSTARSSRRRRRLAGALVRNKLLPRTWPSPLRRGPFALGAANDAIRNSPFPQRGHKNPSGQCLSGK